LAALKEGEMTAIDIDATWTEPFLLVRATSLEGDAWLSDRIESEAIWQGDTLLVEHRFGPDILLGAHNDGLVVALDGRIADAPR
jgi:hypothetical protein